MESKFKIKRPEVYESIDSQVYKSEHTEVPKGEQIKESLRSRNDKPPIFGKYMAGIIKREKTKHLNQMVNSNFLLLPLSERIFLWITRLGPNELVENRPAWIEFSVWNLGEVLTDVFVRARIEPRQSVDEYSGSFNFPIKKLDVGQSIDGAISFQLSRADFKNLITIELCQWGNIPAGGELQTFNVLASDKTEFDIAARFSILMQGIYIRETASHHEDTVFVSFNGQLENTSWSDATNLGNHNNSSRGGILPEVLPVGPFDMVPQSGNSIAIGCVIANAGHTSIEEDAKRALKVVSKVGEITAASVLSIIFPFGAALFAGLAAATDQLHQAILDYAFADCDTVVLHDGKLISEQELFKYTYDANDNILEAYPLAWVIRSQKKVGKLDSDEPLGEGCRDSDYTATFSVVRHRPPEMVHDYNLDGIQLNPIQLVSFGIVGLNKDKIIYELEGNGKIDPHGLFKAPTTITDRKFTIVKWTVFEDTKKGILPLYQDFSIVMLD